MATKSRIGKRVRIDGGMSEFIGKTGTIVGVENEYYRVELDEPVEVKLVGRVTDDLWMGHLLKTIRESHNECQNCGYTMRRMQFKDDAAPKMTCPDCGWRKGKLTRDQRAEVKAKADGVARTTAFQQRNGKWDVCDNASGNLLLTTETFEDAVVVCTDLYIPLPKRIPNN